MGQWMDVWDVTIDGPVGNVGVYGVRTWNTCESIITFVCLFPFMTIAGSDLVSKF